jgi:hypothetical protein
MRGLFLYKIVFERIGYDKVRITVDSDRTNIRIGSLERPQKSHTLLASVMYRPRHPYTNR